jgi:transcriptional regulator with XRE-family HTH domain
MDWKKCITDIHARGFSQAEIAQLCGVKQNTISDLMRGKTADPRYSIGVGLKKLHERVCRYKAPTRPKTARQKTTFPDQAGR